MRKIITLIFCMVLFVGAGYGKKIKLTYVPQGKIIQFNYDSLTLYTDTISLFKVFRNKGTSEDCDSLVCSFVRRAVQNSKSDTVVFNGKVIRFKYGIENKYLEDWNTEWVIFQLIENKKLVMYDKHGIKVNTIITKREGKKKDYSVKRLYINKDTKEVLISKTVLRFRTISDPVW